ncbi:MAG TPA: SMP-30/gluconolactonase/LRE family protein [Bryobacteraceae bacterium]|nr:SMP-30/gluconolactonase/LRE family protein [Bryobacteraceae bacterium]
MTLPSVAAILLTASLQLAADDYKLGPDSQRQSGVPRGSVTQHTWTSRIYPGTVRDYWVYVPAQYDASKPACVMIFQDGAGFVKEDGGWRVPVVFDNLIQQKAMPVTIAILIDPGILHARSAEQQNRYNRSYEYDGLGGRYASFLIDEILPEVGKQLNLSKDPNDRALAGSSSGGIAAFTAAWNRPDAFRRVLSFIGSYTNLRGGDIYPSIIRKTEPKPLRVFLQDGSADQNSYSGSWYLANQSMASALEFSGYESKFVVGTEGHNSKHGGAILPDALRWLWQDYPKQVAKPVSPGSRSVISQILDPGSEWELVSQGYRFTEGPAVDRDGNVFFSDVEAEPTKIYKTGADGKVTLFKADSGGANGLMFGPDGRLYAAQNGRKRIVAYGMDGSEAVIAESAGSNDLAVSSKGEVYFSDPENHRIWFVDKARKKRVVYEGDSIIFPNGIRFSPDESLLLVADTASRWIWSFQVQPDGSLANGEPFYHLELPDSVDRGMMRSGADGMTLDREGYLYVATKLGIQICDQPGRVVGIISYPQPVDASNLVFAGPDMQTLYLTDGDKVYRRHLRRKGYFPWQPLKPPVPRL